MAKLYDDLLDDFIHLMKKREATSKFEEIFSYDDIYKIIINRKTN